VKLDFDSAKYSTIHNKSLVFYKTKALHCCRPPVVVFTQHKVRYLGEGINRNASHITKLYFLITRCKTITTYQYHPMKLSRTDDFPADWDPTTTICGRSNWAFTPNSAEILFSWLTHCAKVSCPDIFALDKWYHVFYAPESWNPVENWQLVSD
jgi:hypothetical protein